MIHFTTKDMVGYIVRRRDADGKETFKFVEAKIKKIVNGKTKISVYTDRFRVLDAEEIESNMQILHRGNNIMLVGEPFITSSDYSEHCRKTVDYWNEHGAESILNAIVSPNIDDE